MTIRSSATLKGYFNVGDVPSEANFSDLIDSAVLRSAVDESIAVKSIAQTISANYTTLRSLDSKGVDANTRLWSETLSTWPNSGGGNNNNTWNFGYNNQHSGVRDTTEPAFYLQLESNYNPANDPLAPVFEYHLSYYPAGEATSYIRPFQINVSRLTGWMEHYVTFDRWNWINRATNTSLATLTPATFALGTPAIQKGVNNAVWLSQLNSTSSSYVNLAYLTSNNQWALSANNIDMYTAGNFGVAVADMSGLTAGGSFAVKYDLWHKGTKAGFFGTNPVTKPTGVAVTAAGIHAALVTLGLIAA